MWQDQIYVRTYANLLNTWARKNVFIRSLSAQKWYGFIQKPFEEITILFLNGSTIFLNGLPKPMERMQVSSERIAQAVRTRVDFFLNVFSKPFERMHFFSRTDDKRLVNGIPFGKFKRGQKRCDFINLLFTFTILNIRLLRKVIFLRSVKTSIQNMVVCYLNHLFTPHEARDLNEIYKSYLKGCRNG